MAPKAVHAQITAIANPPRKCPAKACAARNRPVDMPARSASAPIRMNSGMTDSV